MVSKNILSFVKKHNKEVLVGAVVFLLLLSLSLFYLLYKAGGKIEESNRIISAKVAEIQEFDSRIGVAESDLRRAKDLEKKYKDEIKDFKKELNKKQNQFDASSLEIKSKDETIARLKNIIQGGSSSVTEVKETTDLSGKTVVVETIVDVKEVCSNRILSYTWKDKYDRFELKDPDIGESGDESFFQSQYIKISGVVLQDKTGDIQVKRVVATEVFKEGDKFRDIGGAKLSLVSSKFEYVNEKEGKSLIDIVGLRPFALFDLSAKPGIGLEVLNFGRYSNYLNFGLYGKLALDVSDPVMGSLQNSTVGLGVSYHLLPPLVPTNFAIGASLNTPFNNFGQPIVTLDLILYLTEDINPLTWLK